MRTHATPPIFAVPLLLLGLGVFHSAIPIAVSAQASAVARVQARVVRADAAWRAHELAGALLRARVEASSVTAAPEDVERAGWTRTNVVSPSGGTAGSAREIDGMRWESGGTVAWLERTPGNRLTLVVAHLGS